MSSSSGVGSRWRQDKQDIPTPPGESRGIPWTNKIHNPSSKWRDILIRCLIHLDWLLWTRRGSGSSRRPSSSREISKDEPNHPTEEIHFGCFHLQSHSFSHYTGLLCRRKSDQRWTVDSSPQQASTYFYITAKITPNCVHSFCLFKQFVDTNLNHCSCLSQPPVLKLSI